MEHYIIQNVVNDNFFISKIILASLFPHKICYCRKYTTKYGKYAVFMDVVSNY